MANRGNARAAALAAAIALLIVAVWVAWPEEGSPLSEVCPDMESARGARPEALQRCVPTSSPALPGPTPTAASGAGPADHEEQAAHAGAGPRRTGQRHGGTLVARARSLP